MDKRNNNGRVTMALLGAKMDHLAIDVLEIKAEIKEIHQPIAANRKRIAILEVEQAVVKSRQSIGHIVQGGISLALATIAAWIGGKS